MADIDDIIDELDKPEVTYADVRGTMRRLSDVFDEPLGLPVPVAGFRLSLENGYPFPEFARVFQGRRDTTYAHTCRTGLVEWPTNSWRRPAERISLCTLVDVGGDAEPAPDTRPYLRRDPDRSTVGRIDMILATIGASVAWDLDDELTAQEKLRGLLTPHAWRCYMLTGTFLEVSRKSRVTYLFSRSRPTVAMVPADRNDSSRGMKLLGSLCLHPLGYYDNTYAGAMVPTDDVIAHLLMMRGDEHLYWRRANLHSFDRAESGL